jgi:hypothetical protein
LKNPLGHFRIEMVESVAERSEALQFARDAGGVDWLSVRMEELVDILNVLAADLFRVFSLRIEIGEHDAFEGVAVIE